MTAVPDLQSTIAPAQRRIEVERLDLSFGSDSQDALPILRGVNLGVATGEFVSIVGPSGCGKSTLLRVIAGLTQPSSGQVRIDGQRVLAPPANVGFMFQRDTLMPWATVAENITVGAELGGKSKAASGTRVAELIDFLQLSGFSGHRPHQLSGGMRQRVALGRLLAYEPDIYLMDEPFGALDAQTKVLMGRELLRVWSTFKKSVVFVTHDIEEAVTLSDRVIVLSRRPGSIRLDLRIDLDRPRDIKTLRKDRQFADLCEQLWAALDIDGPH